MKIYDFSEIDKGMEMSPSTAKFIQEGMLDRFESLLKALTGSSTDIIVLHGCEWTVVGDNYTMTEGVVYYNGKIKFVPSFAGESTGGTVPLWDVNTITSEPKGRFADGTFKFVFTSDEMFLSMGVSGSGLADWDETTPFPSIYTLASISQLNLKADKAQEDWHFVGEAGEPAFLNFWNNRYSSTSLLKFRKDDLGNVSIHGIVKNSFDGSPATIFTLPEGYRPSTSDGVVNILCYAFNSGGPGDTVVKMTVLDTGAVIFGGPVTDTFTNYTISLNLKFNIGQ